MSEVKVNKISPRSGTAFTLGDSGDTFTVPSGATLDIASGATVTNNGTQTGFGREGSVNWQTGSLKTATFTAVNGEGYFINQGSAITMNLPAGSAGAIVAVADYARNFSTYNLTISANGSEKIGGVTDDAKLSVDGQAATLVYVDATKGWVNVQNAEDTFIGAVPYSADFLVIAGGGGGGGSYSGGGGAGGYRNSYASETSGGGGSTESDITLTTGATYTITVGDGGAAGSGGGNAGSDGGVSSIIGTGVSITTVGGGGGGTGPSGPGGRTGGSGGGGGSSSGTGGGYPGGAGTTNQGFAGGNGSSSGTGYGGGGGGGAGVAGANYSGGGGNGGNGLASSITGSSVTRAGGGGAGSWTGEGSRASGGSGGGGIGADNTQSGGAGSTNTGSGGGGAGQAAGAGGSGVVILRVPTANYSGTTTGSPTVSTDGSDTVIIFNASGSYTA